MNCRMSSSRSAKASARTTDGALFEVLREVVHDVGCRDGETRRRRDSSTVQVQAGAVSDADR